MYEHYETISSLINDTKIKLLLMKYKLLYSHFIFYESLKHSNTPKSQPFFFCIC